MKGMLVKWDAELLPDPDHPPTDIDPTTHPACIEVIDLNEGQDPKTIYRRQDDASHD